MTHDTEMTFDIGSLVSAQRLADELREVLGERASNIDMLCTEMFMQLDKTCEAHEYDTMHVLGFGLQLILHVAAVVTERNCEMHPDKADYDLLFNEFRIAVCHLLMNATYAERTAQ